MSEWVSVEDELPSVRVVVLIWGAKGLYEGSVGYYVTDGAADKYEGQYEGWYVPHPNEEDVRSYPPTHWMPLPEPPEEESK